MKNVANWFAVTVALLASLILWFTQLSQPMTLPDVVNTSLVWLYLVAVIVIGLKLIFKLAEAVDKVGE